MIKKPVNSAFEDVESPKKWENSAWEECEFAKKWVDSAWEEIWSCIKFLELESNGVNAGLLTLSDDKLELDFNRWMGYDSDFGYGYYGTQSKGGTILLCLDGEWTNPTISFDWVGAFTFSTDEAGTDWRKASAGEISIYTVDASGAENTIIAVDDVGETWYGSTSPSDDSGSYEVTLSGTYNRLGLSIKVSSYSGNFFRSCSTICISNLKFNTTKIAFPDDVEFDKQEWYF